jgi:putative solute:sodium symporter small subunit
LLLRRAAAACFASASAAAAAKSVPPICGRNEKGNDMELTEKHRLYWTRNLKVTGILLGIWFVATFVMSWFARELNEIEILGPLGFYMAAQGSLIIYVAIIWYYARYMNKLDKIYGVNEGEPD